MDNKEFRTNLISRAYNFSKEVITIVNRLPCRISDKCLSTQLVRSATSIGANIVEAQGASSRKDFANFLQHALKSANETKYWLSLIGDTSKCDLDRLGDLKKEADELSKILDAAITKIRRGTKI